jgi:hypothetical protein
MPPFTRGQARAIRFAALSLWAPKQVLAYGAPRLSLFVLSIIADGRCEPFRNA